MEKEHDRGHRLISVKRLQQLCDPFANPPWDSVASLTVAGVRAAMKEGFFQSQPFSSTASACPWSTDDHIARIAYLAFNGWSDPIEVDVGIPHMQCYVDWPVTDGNHRLAAAIVRGDRDILASVAGCYDTMRAHLGRVRLPRRTTYRSAQ